MFRQKVKVAWVENDRTIMFQKRKRRLLKKVRELTTLCGVNAVVIFRGPHDNKPTVWHSGQVTEELLTSDYYVPKEEKKATEESERADHRTCCANAVVIFRGPHDNKPTMWHSGQVTEQSRKLIVHFEPDLDLPSSSFSLHEGEDEEKMMSKIGGFKNDMQGI
ncbi:hypothetical protein DVH24_030646 [Malus domestica]|uniref:MADS-box domain-containing protein n=1 Tax=Malus domestica TaxID=3750 RepID=A0A498JY54_MALDO|nr:hypothetical protein DVH24_030646 [Malus domestica]